MVGRVIVDLVDAVAEAVVGAHHGRVLVGEPAQLDRLGAAGERADLARLLVDPAGALALNRLHEGHVAGVEVDALEGGSLVEDLVGVPRRALADGAPIGKAGRSP